MDKSLLIVWVYYPAVGHFVEAVEVAAAYRGCNPSLKIAVMLNSKTISEIGSYCQWIDQFIPIDVEEVTHQNNNAPCLQDIPRNWDFIIFPKGLKYTPEDYSKDLLTCNLQLGKFLIANECAQYHYEKNEIKALSFEKYPSYQLALPLHLIEWAKKFNTAEPIFTIMFEGASTQKIYPSITWWKKTIIQIKKKYPRANFILTGIIPKNGSDISIKKYAQNLDQLSCIPGVHNYYNVELDKQLALIAGSDIFISPHTGFAFLAPAVGTPWLCISGTYWAEQAFARMPFFSVLPHCSHYPCNGKTKWQCKLLIKAKMRPLCMGRQLNLKFPDIFEGIKFLLNKESDFHQSAIYYEKYAIRNGVNINQLFILNEYKTLNKN